MASSNQPYQLLDIFRATVLSSVRGDDADLSARQLAVLLTVYLTKGPHTVRGLAAELNVSRPAITRALDRLAEFDLARRKIDPFDRRSINVQQTPAGLAHIHNVRMAITAAAQIGGMCLGQAAEAAAEADSSVPSAIASAQ